MSSKKHYFIAVLPPPPISAEINEIKNYIAEKFHSKAALRSPPHITLYMPFWWEEEEEKLKDYLLKFAAEQTPLEIALKGFGAFPPRVIYIKIKAPHEFEILQFSLKDYLRDKPGIFNEKFFSRPFRPHLTVAFRDLTKIDFERAWLEFKNKQFNHRFKMNALCLLKHNGKHWEIDEEFKMSS